MEIIVFVIMDIIQTQTMNAKFVTIHVNYALIMELIYVKLVILIQIEY